MPRPKHAFGKPLPGERPVEAASAEQESQGPETQAELAETANKRAAALARSVDDILAEGEQELQRIRDVEAKEGFSAEDIATIEARAGVLELPGIRREITETGTRAETALREAAAESTEGFNPALERLNRDLEAAEALRKLESNEPLAPQERKMLAGILESRGWHKLLSGLKEGDSVATVLVPSGETFSIKNLNDNILGMQKTDDLIKFRRDTLGKQLAEVGLQELTQSFRDGFFRIPKERQTSDVMERLRDAVQQVNTEVTTYLNNVLDEEQKGASVVRKDSLARFRAELNQPEKGYRMTFGVSTVEAPNEEGDYTNVELAVGNGLKAAMMAREHALGGAMFQEADAEAFVGDVAKLRGRIEEVSLNNQITDEAGRTFPVFETLPNGSKQLNLDIIRDLRKGKLKPGAGSRQSVALLKEYLAKINVLDVLKPYTHDEIAGDTIYGSDDSLQDHVVSTRRLCESLTKGRHLSGEDRADIAKAVKTEGKDRACTSALEFNSKALQIPDCTYMSLDVLDVGPKLLQEFERLLQDVEHKRKTMRDVSLTAGDETTLMMRAFRATVARVVREETKNDAAPLMLVGGDEATVALDSSLVTEKLLLRLRRETGSRVVKTVVASAERSSDMADPERVKREHLDAKKRAEEGANLAKEIETSLRAIGHMQQTLPPDAKRDVAKQVTALHLDYFAIVERPGAAGFDVMLEEGGGTPKRLPFEDIRKRFEVIRRFAQGLGS